MGPLRGRCPGGLASNPDTVLKNRYIRSLLHVAEAEGTITTPHFGGTFQRGGGRGVRAFLPGSRRGEDYNISHYKKVRGVGSSSFVSLIKNGEELTPSNFSP